MLNRDWIAAHIPHQGGMCLLDKVVDWSDQGLVCEAVSHQDPQNPLRWAGRLGAATGVEYAAQAMAVHGALLAKTSSAPSQGYLTSVRGLVLQVSRLDDQIGPLRISVERLSGDDRLILYQFHIRCREKHLLQGRASVVLDMRVL